MLEALKKKKEGLKKTDAPVEKVAARKLICENGDDYQK